MGSYENICASSIKPPMTCQADDDVTPRGHDQIPNVDSNKTDDKIAISDQPAPQQQQFENSTTIVIATGGNNSRFRGHEDLEGQFIEESLESTSPDGHTNEQGVDKYLTLAVHPLVRTPSPTQDVVAVQEETEGDAQTGDIGEENIEEINRVQTCEETIAIEKKESVNTKVSLDMPSVTVSDRHEKTVSDSKRVVRHKPHSKRNGSKSVGKLHDPVFEMDETVADNELVKRDNEVQLDHRPVLDTSSGQLVSRIEVGPEYKQPIGEVLSNRSPLYVNSSAKEDRSSRKKTQILARSGSINRKDNRLHAIITDDRTSNSRKYSEENIKRSRTRCQTARIHRGRNINLHQNNLLSRSLDRSVNMRNSQSSLENSEKQRAVSVFEQRYTMLELRKALPRRSFFNCHEKAMKDAGLEVDDPVAKRKAERLKARLERIANEYNHMTFASESCKDSNEVAGLENNTVNIAITNITGDEDTNENEEIDIVATSKALENDSKSHIEIHDSEARIESSKLSLKPARHKRPQSARSEHVDCKPLLQYLEYVRDNREEYLNHVHASQALLPSKEKPSSRLVNLGKAFELRHLGGVPRHHENDVIVMATKALRPRCSDPAKYTRSDRDKTPNSTSLRAHDAARQGRPSSEDKRRQEKNSATTHAKEEEHAKTELEKKKLRAEEWAKTVSTNTLTKAKIQSLRQLGADDNELMKWWDAFKQCRYLRDTWPVLDNVL